MLMTTTKTDRRDITEILLELIHCYVVDLLFDSSLRFVLTCCCASTSLLYFEGLNTTNQRYIFTVFVVQLIIVLNRIFV
jgi:hypothetical protein